MLKSLFKKLGLISFLTLVFLSLTLTPHSHASDPAYRMDAQDQGIVLRPDTSGGALYPWDGGGIREAIINKVGSTYYMFYDGAAPNNGLWRACLASSTDLVHWTKLGKQLNAAIDDYPGGGQYRDLRTGTSPWVYYDNGQWYMYYLGCISDYYGIPSCPYFTLLAKSANITGPWTKENYQAGKSKNVCFYTRPGTWMSDSASPGQVIQNPKWTGPGDPVNKKYLMFFSGSGSPDGTFRRSIGIARTNDLNVTDAYDAASPNFWSVDPNPILPPTDDIENTSIYYEPSNGYYFMFTNHIYNNAYTNACWVYWTTDVESWDPNNKAVVLDSSNCTWAKGAIGMPTVVKVDDTRLALVYDGCEGTDTSHLNRKIGLAYLNLPLVPPSPGYSLLNAGFESPATATYQYGPMTNGWTFDSASGVQHNGSAWGAQNAPEGVQTCFLQGLGSITQSISFNTGTYKVNFKAAKRTTHGGTQSIDVYFDTTKIGTFTPNTGTFTDYSTNTFTTAAGVHTIKFVGTVSGDNTDFIDAVSISSTTENAAPRVAANASSTVNSSWAAGYAIDNNTGNDNGWSSVQQSQTGNQWINVDFGATYSINKIKVIPRTHNNTVYSFPQDFKFQSSINGTTWTDIAGQSYTNYPNPANNSGEIFTLAAPVNTRYLQMMGTKFRTDDFNNYFMQICEIYGLTSGSNPNLAIGATATASTTYPTEGYSPSRVNDGSNSTALGGSYSWSNAYQAPLPQWVQLDFGTTRTFNRIELYTTDGYQIRDYQLQYWNGSTWSDLIPAITGNTQSHRTHAFTANTSQKIRVLGNSGPSIQPGFIRVNEIEVY